MSRTLYIESGTTGGGSFESLWQHIKVMNNNNDMIICFNKTHYNEKWSKLGAKVIQLEDPLFTSPKNGKLSKLNNKIISKFYSFSTKHNRTILLLCLRIIHFRTLKKINYIIKKKKIDILHLNTNIQRELFVLLLAKKYSHLKIYSGLRSTRSENFTPTMAEFANNNVSRFIANSEFTKRYWVKKGINSKKITVVHNIVFKETYQKIDLFKTYNIPLDYKHICVCVANFSVAKGHLFLLNSFNELIKSKNDVFLLLAGKGSRSQEIEIRIKELNLGSKVKMIGYQKNILDIISSSDCVLIPSKNEAFGRVAIEAMYCKTPVIATYVGGLKEIITDYVNGLLVNYGDESMFASKIIELFNNDSLYSRLVENGYQTYSNRFTLDTYVKKYNNLYS
jgi:glycosyltransferase involved in cell wall biosynthesis